MAKVIIEKEGDGTLAEHGSKVVISWYLRNYETKINEAQSLLMEGAGDTLELSDPSKWQYSFVGHKQGSAIKVKFKAEGARKYYGAFLDRVITGENNEA